MAKGTGSSASTKRMQNMITQVNNNSNGNGDVLNPHIPPVQNLSEPGEHSAEEMKLMEGSTVLPTLNVSSSPKRVNTLTKTSHQQLKKGVKHGVKKGEKTRPTINPPLQKSPLQKSGKSMMVGAILTPHNQTIQKPTHPLKPGKTTKTLTPTVKTTTTTGVKHGVKTGVKN